MKKNNLKNLINIPEFIILSLIVFAFELILNLSVASVAIGNGSVSPKDTVISVVLLIMLSVTASLDIWKIRNVKKKDSEFSLILVFFAVSSVFQNSTNLGLLQSLMFALILFVFLCKIKRKTLIISGIMFIQSLFMSNTLVIYLPLIFILFMLTYTGRERILGIVDISASASLGYIINTWLDLPQKLNAALSQHPNLNLEDHIVMITKEMIWCLVIIGLTLIYYVAEYIFMKKTQPEVRKSSFVIKVTSVFVPMILCMVAELFSYSDTAFYISPVFGVIVMAFCCEDSWASEINRKICELFREHNAAYIVVLGLIAVAVTYNHNRANALYDAVKNFFWMFDF